MHADVLKVLASPDIKERLEKLGAAPMPTAQAAFRRQLDAKTTAATPLVNGTGIKLD